MSEIGRQKALEQMQQQKQTGINPATGQPYTTPTTIYKPQTTPQASSWIQQQRMQEYRVAPLVAPILMDIKRSGINERLSDVIYAQAEKASKQPQFFGYPKMTGGLQVFGGMVEAGESMVEMVFPYSLPPPPRPLTVARIGGIVAGDILAGQVASWVFEPQLQYIGEKISGKASEYLTQKYVEKGPLEWKGFTEKLVMKVTGATPSLAPEVVSFPTPSVIGMQGLEAQQLAWELTQAPKVSGLMITKVGPEQAVFTFTRGIGYTPMAVTLAKAMSVKEMGGRQATVEITIPELKTLPYIPTIEPISSESLLPKLLGIGIGIIPKTFTYTTSSLEQPQRLTQKTIAAQIEDITQITIPTQASALAQSQMQQTQQLQKQIQQQLTEMGIPTSLKQTSMFPYYPTDDLFKRKKGRKATFGFALYSKKGITNPIATARKVLEKFL